MRPIKFRAWDVQNKRFIENVQDSCKSLDENDPFYYLGEALDDGNYVVEQYTGIKDKNGVEIYEGDIIKSEGYLPASVFNGNFAVTWDEENLIWIAGCFRLATFLPGVTVIGNVHQNPELLEAVK